MKWWHRYLSYISEVRIECSSSDHHDYLQVSAIQGRYQLSTDKSIYSFDDLYLNFYKAFSKLEMPAAGADVLVLGLGLASIPWMLERSFDKKYHYVCVDIDEEVIRLASKYRIPMLQSPLEVQCCDAGIFLDVDNRKFDLICVDVFLDDLVPNHVATLDRVRQLRDKLSTDGVLLWNRLYRTGTDKQLTQHFYESVFSQAGFGDSSHMDVDGNWILIGKG